MTNGARSSENRDATAPNLGSWCASRYREPTARMRPHWRKPHAPASMSCGFATADQIGNRLRRIRKVFGSQCTTTLSTPKHPKRLRQYYNSVSLCLCMRLSAVRLRQTPFPKISNAAKRPSQSAGAATGRAAGLTAHEACFDVATDPARYAHRASPAVFKVRRGSAPCAFLARKAGS